MQEETSVQIPDSVRIKFDPNPYSIHCALAGCQWNMRVKSERAAREQGAAHHAGTHTNAPTDHADRERDMLKRTIRWQMIREMRSGDNETIDLNLPAYHADGAMMQATLRRAENGAWTLSDDGLLAKAAGASVEQISAAAAAHSDRLITTKDTAVVRPIEAQNSTDEIFGIAVYDFVIALSAIESALAGAPQPR